VAVAQETVDPAHVGHADDRAQAHSVGVLLRHPDPGVVRKDPELVETDLARRSRPCLDALHDADTVIRVDDLLTDLEDHADLLVFLSTALADWPVGKGIEPMRRV